MLNMCYIFSLEQSHVKAYVLFDGGSPINRSKCETLKSRKEESIRRNYPWLLAQVFKDCARKYVGERLIQCDFEADDDILFIAKKLNAFVLSSDSDFFIADVPFLFVDVGNKIGCKSKFSPIPTFFFNRKQFCKVILVLSFKYFFFLSRLP